MRQTFHSSTGKVVPASCIRKTAFLPGDSKERTDVLKMSAIERAKTALRMSKKAHMKVPVNCPPGTRMRSGYVRGSFTRKTGTHINKKLVAPGCIKQRGKGNGEKVIVLDPKYHYLSEFGYKDIDSLTVEQRRDALHKLLNHYVPLKGEMVMYNFVIKELNARYILNRNTNPKLASIFKQDQKYISKQYRKLKKMQQ
jgi:hypothetical protein